ncbi:MAG: PaaI family thioesterase [bacterium]|nr:PaaI family thioesterase [bacterium]
MTDSTARTLTVTWDDPMIGANAALEMEGLEYLHAMLRGDIPRPPISVLLNFTLTHAEPGRTVFEAHPAEQHYNPIGVVHGGYAATILDSALGCAVMTRVPKGFAYTTVDLNVHLVRAITKETGVITATADVIHAGRRVATAEARLTDAAGKLYAHATTTCMILPVNGG